MADQAISEKLKVKDGGDRIPVFIHSELDDYGLSPVEFRVYSRVARRAGLNGKHSESIPKMAHAIRISPRTVQYALRLLTICGLITPHTRPGRTDEYSLNPLSSWRDKGQVRRATGDRGAASDSGVVQPKYGVVVQPETEEGTPSKVPPPKGSPLKKAPSPKNGDGASETPASVPTDDFTIWSLGAKKIVASNEISMQSARSFLGEQVRSYGKSAVAKAVVEMLAQEAIEPRSYIVKVLQGRNNVGPGTSRVERSVSNVKDVIAELETQK